MLIPLICPNASHKGCPVRSGSRLPYSNNATNGSPRGGENADIHRPRIPFGRDVTTLQPGRIVEEDGEQIGK